MLVEKLTRLLESPATRMSKMEVACPMSVLDNNLNHMFITAKLHALELLTTASAWQNLKIK